MTQASDRQYVTPYALALVYAGLGGKDRAFANSRVQLRTTRPAVVMLKSRSEVEMNSLRADPRFAELERRVGLPD